MSATAASDFDAGRLGDVLIPAGRSLGLELGESALASLARFASLLLAWNRRINLTGARDLETLAREHLADALALVPFLPSAGTCLDVGSGAGLPGIVLAILRPEIHFQLLEPSQKRRAFLAAAVRELGLANVAVAGDRLEAHTLRVGAAYDLVVSRAVFDLPRWLDIGRPLVRPGGVLVGLAGGVVPEDLPPDAETHPYDVGSGPRTVVLVRL